ncbi:flagellar biosynthesis protein [Frigidibacter sp. MR17.14]|uniref:FliH/SctL family protein n=1 Tax=Frigidibacter sp. MR17.14 TaxID=3126509 RepID=UPI003012C40D
MTRRLELQSFEPSVTPPPPPAEASALEVEEARLAGYEQGYAAGWEDAVAAQDRDLEALRGDLGRNLRELSFSYQQARSHVLQSLEPLLVDMVAKVLPRLAQEALGPMVIETLRPMAEALSAAPVEITLNPSARPAVESLLDRSEAPPFRILEEPTLGEGQAFLRLGSTERQIDLDGTVAAIGAAVSAFFRPDRREASE